MNPGGILPDKEMQRLLLITVTAKGSKVILTSRKSIDLSFIPQENISNEVQPPVGLFPKAQTHGHVEQLLAVLAGIKSCPEILLQSINRHPLLAVLAGLYIKKIGASNIHQNKFLNEAHRDLRSELIARIVDDEARPAIEAISALRIPVPRQMLVQLSSLTSVKTAEELGLLFKERDRCREDLISCIGILRTGRYRLEEDGEADVEMQIQEESEKAKHKKICEQYQQLYRTDRDPKWLREIYYHKLLSGNATDLDSFGIIYRSEIYGAGEYWFKAQKKYDFALWAFQLVKKYGDENLLVRMRIASCLMRIGKEEGETEFIKLIVEFNEMRNIVSSYIDALLYLKKYKEALHKLGQYKIEISSGQWFAGQYGRAYFGLHQYGPAIKAYREQLKAEPSSYVYQNLARAYHGLGDTPNEKIILDEGLERYPDSRRLRLSMAALSERVGLATQARDELLKLHASDPFNAWIILPLVKALSKCSQLSKAKEIFKAAEENLYPEFMKHTINAEIAMEEERFPDAIKILAAREIDEHSLGQKYEAYFSWAGEQNSHEEKKRIAKEGLRDPLEEQMTKNVPLLVSRGKLAIVADDKTTYDSILHNIKSLNPGVSELEKVMQQYRPEWSS